MRRRSLLLVVALLVASAVVTAGSLPGRVSAQDDPLTAAVIDGSCDNPGDVAFELRDLATAEGGVLTSFSRIDLPIADATSGDYAIVVESEGDTAACGDISGSGNDVYVAVTSQSDAGLGGVAWLHARDSQTQVSLFISEGLGGGGTGTDEPGPPEPPVDETPEVDPTPEIEIDDTPEPADGLTYESPTFGYTVTYDDSVWQNLEEATTPTDNGPQDFLHLFNGTSHAYFFTNASPASFDVSGCPGIMQNRLASDQSISDLEIRTDDNGDPITGGNSMVSFVAFNFTWTNQNGEEVALFNYYQCYQLPGQEAVLIFINEGQQRSYDQQTDAREELLAGVEIPG